MEAFLITVGILAVAFLVYIRVQRSEYHRRQQEEQRRSDERKRVEGCGGIVLFFANNLGYIARQAISRQELEDLIDSGIQPEGLANEIIDRLEKIDGLVLGAHRLGGVDLPVKLTQDFRDRHVYIVGKSGSGKTTLLRNMIIQDMWRGNGIGVIAPEQEMIVDEILPYVPEHRLDDVVYFNPADSANPVALNPLHLEDGEDIDLKVDETMTVFRRLMADETGPRMEEILRQTLFALMEVPGSTLLDVSPLLDRVIPENSSQNIMARLRPYRRKRF